MVGAVVVALAAGAARGDAGDRDATYRRLNQSLVERHVLPRYARLAVAAVALDEAARGFCEALAPPGLDAVRSAFHAAADAWHDAEHLRFGPMESRLRAERLAFWPDPRNVTGRQLGGLLAARDPATLTRDGFLRTSAAVQGLPAVERVLFDDGAPEAFRGGDDAARRRCEVLQAITRNVATIAREAHEEWAGGDRAYARRIATAGPGNATYRTPGEATLDLFKSLHGGLERIATLKLARPLGPSPGAARPALAEEWRSGRTVRNLRLNLAALRALYLGEDGPGFSDAVREAAGAEDLDRRVRRDIEACLATVASLSEPFGVALTDPRTRPAVERLLANVRALAHLAAERLTIALDLPLGFNALDGD